MTERSTIRDALAKPRQPTKDLRRIGASRHVFFVHTPLQLLNALEAKWALNIPAGLLVVVANDDRRRQLEALIDTDDWGAVHTITATHGVNRSSSRMRVYRSMWKTRRALDLVANHLGEVDSLFLGNYGSRYGQHLASRIDHRTLYLLDDGTATVAIADRRAAGRMKAALPMAMIRTRLLERVLGFQRHSAPAVVFFTTFDLQVGPRDTVIANTFQRLRSRGVTASLTREALFLGQPLVENREMAEETYVAYIAGAQRHYASEALVYAPHPGEETDRVERLSRRLGLQVRYHQLPVEAELARSGRLPTSLASFHTSALDNCRLMFRGSGMRITAFAIARADLHQNHEFTDSVYAYFRRHQGPEFSVQEPG
ncbi:MAG: hypothetical protein LC667_17050 [Thioalkalivibrio sp.]|nr:hypothetical protein [Thioalkalivibrio sp.]